MKINKKHVISLVLALAMVLSCMPGIALAAEAADTYDRPTGRSIVLNYDGYMEAAGKVWAEELLATLPATATKGGEGEYPITWPSAAEIESIVDPDALGYYAIAGAVDGVSNAVSITIQVRTKTNLLYNPSFEENTWNSAAGWYGGDWSYRSTSDTAKKTIVPTPVEGAFSFQIYTSASAWTKAQIRYQDDTRAQALATAVKAEGDGQYAVSIYAMDSTSANETTFPYPEHTAPLAVAIDILASEGTTSAGYQFIGSSAGTEINRDGFTKASGVFTLENVASYNWLRTDFMLTSEEAFTERKVFLDMAEMIALNVALKAEPAHITEVLTQIPARAIAKNYDTYVGDNWQARMGLPTEIEAVTSEGQKTVGITWDYDALHLDTVGRYVLTGTPDSAYLVASGVKLQQIIYVREAENLIKNGGFNSGKDGFSFNTQYISSAELIEEPRKEGEYSVKLTSAFNSALTFLDTNPQTSTVSAAVKAQGAGQYYFGIWSRGDDNGLIKVTARLYRTGASVVAGSTAILTNTEFVRSYGVVNLPADANNVYVDVYAQATGAGVYGKVFYVDQFELIPLNIELTDFAEPVFDGASLTLQNNLSIRFNAEQSLFGTDFTDPYVKFAFNSKSYTVTEPISYTENNVAMYAFEFSNIAPHQIADTVTATLCATYGGTEVELDTVEYSVLTYCKNMMGKGDAELDTLLADLLNYGAALQTSLGETDLVTNGMDLSAATATDVELESCIDLTTGTVNDPAAVWDSATLVLFDNVTIRLYFTAESVDGLSVKIVAGEQTLDTISEIKQDGDIYYVDFDGLMATQMRTQIKATVCNGDTVVSETVTYSVESYAAKHKNDTAYNLGALVTAMMKYGDSAAAYPN